MLSLGMLWVSSKGSCRALFGLTGVRVVVASQEVRSTASLGEAWSGGGPLNGPKWVLAEGYA